jgi:hypothetical protein
VSAEIATSVTFPSVSVSAARSGPAQVRWDLNHYVDTIFDRQWTLTWPDTTVSGMTATTWALYSFRRDINDGAPPQMQVDIRLTGNFASIVNKFWPGGQALTLPYESSWQTLPFPVPVLRTEQPYTPENPIRIAPGQTVKVKIIASSPQLLLSWKPYEIPTDREGRQYLAVTPTSSFLGDGELQITALEFAAPGFAYLRLNSVPPGAADSLRQGGLDLPIKIVEPA